MDTFLDRVDSTLSLPDILKKTAQEYNLGPIKLHTPISTGYQECNIDLVTTSGRYVVKIFSKEKTKKRIDDVMAGYVTFKKHGIPFPTARSQNHGEHLMEIQGKEQTSYLCVFDYFEGKPLTQTSVSDGDVHNLTHSMALMHKTKKTIDHYYDTLGIVNIAHEYTLKKDVLFPDEQAIIEPIIAKFKRIKLASFRQSIIHGSLEKENILKNTLGELCLLDLGCMDYNASVLDIATFIANFTVYLDAAKRSHIINLVLETYQKAHPLSHEELVALPTLISTQYATYIIVMTHKMRKNHDMTKQTQTWLDRGWGGLKKSL